MSSPGGGGSGGAGAWTPPSVAGPRRLSAPCGASRTPALRSGVPAGVGPRVSVRGPPGRGSGVGTPAFEAQLSSVKSAKTTMGDFSSPLKSQFYFEKFRVVGTSPLSGLSLETFAQRRKIRERLGPTLTLALWTSRCTRRRGGREGAPVPRGGSAHLATSVVADSRSPWPLPLGSGLQRDLPLASQWFVLLNSRGIDLGSWVEMVFQRQVCQVRVCESGRAGTLVSPPRLWLGSGTRRATYRRAPGRRWWVGALGNTGCPAV